MTFNVSLLQILGHLATYATIDKRKCCTKNYSECKFLREKKVCLVFIN